jgi:ubiquinone/menaquinone biosynthesis C-methylase UbiE
MFDLLKYNLRSIKSKSWRSAGKAAVYEKQTSVKGDYQDFLTNDYISELTKRLNKRSKILDLGCGTGVLSLNLATLGYNITALDISKGMLGELEKKIGSLPISTIQGDVFDQPFSEEKFDGIITRWVLPHFEDWPLIVNESTMYLKKGGIFIFDMTSKENYEDASKGREVDFDHFGYNPYNNKSKGYYSSASIKEIRGVAQKAGLEVLDIIPNGYYRTNALLYGRLGEAQYKIFLDKFNELYKNEDIKEFVQWFDLTVTKKLPENMVNTFTVITKKR